MVTNVYMKFNYDRLRVDKASGKFLKSDNHKNNVRSVWPPFPGGSKSQMKTDGEVDRKIEPGKTCKT